MLTDDISFISKLAIQYNRLQHPANTFYKPSTVMDKLFTKAYPLFLKTLPKDYSNYSVTDVGSGAGKWTAVYSKYFSNVTSIEPNVSYMETQKKFLSSLKLRDNITFKNEKMPECIDTIDTAGAFFIESLYLANNWIEAVQKIANNRFIQYVVIVDGKDLKDNPFGKYLNIPIDGHNRLPLLEDDVLTIKQMLESANYRCQMYNVWDNTEIETPCDRWFIVGYRNA